MLQLSKQEGWGLTRLSRALGIAVSVVHRWRALAATGTGGKPGPRSSKPKLRRVRVVEEAPPPATFVLTFPSGATVTGLTLTQLGALVRGGL